MDNNNVPEIRFEGFNNPWEQRKLETVATFSKGNGYSKGDLQKDGTPIILYGRLYTKYETTISEVDTFVSEKSGSVYSQGGEVIIPASGETAEDIARASTIENKGILLGGDLNVVTPNEDVNSAFLALSISNGAAHKELASKAQGKSVVHIHNAEIQALNIAFPSRSEQSRISGYFAKLDALITLHQCKYEKLLDLKKSMLYKLFPKEGETVPDIRFEGFSGAWKSKPLSDLLEERNTQLAKDEEYPLKAFIAYEGITDKGDRYDRSSLVKDEENKKYKRTELGDFIYSSNNLTTGSIGLNKFGKASISPVYSIFSTKCYVDSNFIGELLTKKEFINRMTRTRQGVVYGQWRIHENDFLDLIILAPDYEEQKAIGDYFSNLEKLIQLNKRKIEKLKNIKSSLLDKMFV